MAHWKSVALAVTLCASTCTAASPGVPEISSTPAGYIDYAITNAPAYYKSGVVAAQDNTPGNNPITDAGAELGRVLFYDQRLSHNDGASCASCHVQENGFADPAQFSEGFEGGLTQRHSPGLANAAFYQRGRFFWDERAATLEEQVLMPIEDSVEMGSSLDELEDELQATEFYPVLFERAFGDSQVTQERMAEAMAQFVRSMVSYQSKYDVARSAGAEGSAAFQSQLTTLENEGHTLFAEDCAQCHRGASHSADQPHNIGLDATNADDAGVNGEFKVASLRNAAVRGRFMHDGRFSSLEEVIEFYSSGIQDNPDLNTRRLDVGGFGYTEAEEAALLAFLNTLTDDVFLTSDLFSDPFVDLPGDFNGDGVVDVDDFEVWRNDFGAVAEEFAPLMADGNSDGVVDAADFTIWRDNLGSRWDDGLGFASASLAAAPEPASIALVLFTWLACLPRRHRPSPK